MSDSGADRLFERYRRTRSPRVLARFFDRVAPELHRVALHLAGDPDLAADAVQDTFVTAIQATDQHVPGRPALPWLLGVLANRIRETRRSAQRTPDPERLGLGVAASAHDLAASRELEAALDAALGSLDAPYREVVVLHVRHGMTAKEIAAALGRPAGTVRTQVVRGLERLRGLLPAGFATTALAAVAGATLAPRVRAAVLEHALRHAPAGATVGGSAALTALGIGGLFTMKKLLATVGVAAACAVGWLTWPSLAPGAPVADPDVRIAAAETAVAGAPRDAAAAEDQTSGSRSHVTSSTVDAPSATGAVDLTFVWAGDEAPAAGARFSLLVYPERDGGPSRSGRWSADADGRIERDGLEPARYHLMWFGGSIVVEVVAGETTRERRILEPHTDVTGRVVDPDGELVAGAELWAASLADSNDPHPVPAGRAAADGTFRVRATDQPMLWASAAGYAASDARSVQGETTIELQLTDAGPLVTGRVVDPDGRPVAAAELLAIPGRRKYRIRPPERLTTRADGSFVTDRLAAEEHAFVVTAPGFALGHRIVDVTSAPLPITLALTRGATWTGRVLVGDEPVPAWIDHSPAWTDRFSYSWNLAGGKVAVDASGRFETTGLPPGTARFQVYGSRFPSHDGIVELVDGETTQLDVIIAATATTSVRGRVLGPDGEGLEHWDVHTSGDSTQTDAEGRFTLQGLDPERAPFTLHTAPRGLPRFGWADVVEAAAGADDVEIRVRHRYDDHARVRGRAVDRDGRPVSNASVSLRSVNRSGHPVRETHEPARSFRFRVAPGRYQVSVEFADDTATDAGIHDLVAGQLLDLGDIGPPPLTRFAIRLVDAAGELHVPSRLAVSGRGGHAAYPEPPLGPAIEDLGDGWYRTPQLGVGRFTVWVRGATFAPHYESVDVGPGGESRFTIAVRAAQPVRFEFTGLEPADADGLVMLSWTVTRSGGDPLAIGSPIPIDAAEPTVTFGFEPGRYTVEAGPEGSRVRVGFEVPAERSATPIPVRVELGR